ncbi:CPCC family cysteine-rich protein [Pararhizobium gei]|uniref:CPCC family cysteine-rich protein n=1 Tax=Pararhizobium gei TaxID=1395951 RepID=UPI003313089F
MFTIDHLGDYEICDVCNWEDDPVQSADVSYAGGANEISLIEARKIWKESLKSL